MLVEKRVGGDSGGGGGGGVTGVTPVGRYRAIVIVPTSSNFQAVSLTWYICMPDFADTEPPSPPENAYIRGQGQGAS